MPHPSSSVLDRSSAPNPIPAAWILEGTPTARSRPVCASPDGNFSATLWECTPGRFRWQYRSDEIIHILEGEVFVDGQRFVQGDVVFFAANTSADWDIKAPLRKLALHRSLPYPAWRKAASQLKHRVQARVAALRNP